MNDYERENKERYDRTGGRVGMSIPLDKGPAFWSRGWRGCPGCGGDAKGAASLRPFSERDSDLTRSGWRCA